MGQESRHDFAGSSVLWSLLRLQLKCQPELGSPLKAQLGKALPGSKHMGSLAGSRVSYGLLDREPCFLGVCG